MKKIWTVLPLLCAALLAFGTAQADISFPDTVSGTVYYPEGSDADTATYVYTYSYPVAEGTDEAVGMINENYTYWIEDAKNFTVPILGESAEGSGIQAYSHVTATVTCVNEQYVSILIVNESKLGEDDFSIVYTGNTFPLSGADAGEVTSLPYLLGTLNSEDEADEWLEERQAAKAEECIRRMVWEQIEENPPATLLEDADEEKLSAVFYPEDDFYLNQDGDFVFYVEPGMMADTSEGALLFTFSLEDILDEL